jgi:hypothetical protein
MSDDRLSPPGSERNVRVIADKFQRLFGRSKSGTAKRAYGHLIAEPVCELADADGLGT